MRVETGIDSGTFVATFKTGATTNTGVTPQIVKAIQGGILNVIYTDTIPAASSVTKTLSLSSFDATMAFDADSYSLDTYAVVTLADAERNTNYTTAESLLSDVYIQTSSVNSTKVRMVETGVDTGTFKGSIQIASSGGTTEFSLIQATEGDSLKITYDDTVNTKGYSRTVTDTATVKSEPCDGTETLTLYSDTETEYFNGTDWTSAALAWVYSTWTNIEDAKWIWESYLVKNPTNEETVNFRKTFTIPNNVNFDTIAGTIKIAADNSVSINLNGSYIGEYTGFTSTKDFDISSFLVSGQNTLNLSVTNHQLAASSPYNNPAGVIFAISIKYCVTSQDTTPPTVTITSPTTDDTYTTTSSTISLGGSASDATSGVSSVAWSSNKGESGTASGTTSWSISNISLTSGDNVITVTATDGAGNTGTDTITVTYESAKGIIIGFVMDEDGLPLENVLMSLTGPDTGSTKTDADGYFSFEGLAAGDYTVCASTITCKDISVGEGEVREVEFYLVEKPNGSIFGFVKDEDELPLKNVLMSLTGPDAGSTKTDEDGFYIFEELAAGDYTLEASKSGYQTIMDWLFQTSS